MQKLATILLLFICFSCAHDDSLTEEYPNLASDSKTIEQGLSSIGVKKEVSVAVQNTNNSGYQIMVLHNSLSALGANIVTINDNLVDSEISLIADKNCAYGVFENVTQLEKIIEKIKEVPQLKTIILIEKFSDADVVSAKKAGITVYNFDELILLGKNI